MFRWLASLFSRTTVRRSMPFGLTGGQWTGTAFVDSYKRNRAPSPNELLAELKGVAWVCASLNASACASHAPRRPAPAAPVCFVSESEVRAAVEAALAAVDFGKIVEDQVRLLYEKHTGRV
jgi:hypothetical protein